MKKLLLLSLIFLISTTLYPQKRIAGPSKDQARAASSPSVTNMDGTTTTAQDLVLNILGPGISYSNISFTGLTGPTSSAGLFTNGGAAGLGFETGIILSSGYINNVVGPNISSGITGDMGLPGDADLTALIPGYTTNDATILEFDFSLPADSIYIEFIFGSDEYNEWVGSLYNDVFAFFLDGSDIALVPGTSTPVAINNVNNGSNSSYYLDNTSGIYNIESDGFTTTITGTFPLNSNPTHHIKLAIADAGDHVLDSWVFIRASSFSIPIEVDLGPDIDLCEGESAVLDAGNTGYEFLWSTGETTQTITVDTEGEYYVDVSYLGNTESDTIYVSVNDLPTADAGDDAVIYIGYPPLNTQLNASGGVSYSWYPTTGLSDPNIADPIAQPDVTTTYTVTVTDENGCIDSDEVTVVVNDIRCGKKMDKVLVCHIPPGNVGEAHTICISPNAVAAHLAHGDYLGECYDDAGNSFAGGDSDSGIEHSLKTTLVNKEDWSVYPNPVKNNVSINLLKLQGSDIQLTIYDLSGRVYWELPKQTLESSVINIDLKNLPSGIYQIVLLTDSQKMVKKLVITK
ncbi:MAG: hypothetical protein C0595_14415 [Marinilabiliales bacterium]|nr:MAG: hypothetical protein C0595_14415 [Marinilabiliales bacterium]